MKVSAQYAQEHFADILTPIDTGEEVELTRPTPAQLSTIEISPTGFGNHLPMLDADLYVPSLLEGFLGSRKWMASRLGAQGDKSRSTGKAAAARANGALGGRPRKLTAQ